MVTTTNKVSDSEAIKVIVRVRPLNSRETQDGRQVVTIANEKDGSISVVQPNNELDDNCPPKVFTFDHVFGPSSDGGIYKSCAAPIVKSVLEGYNNGTLFVYGQTGAGKTFTMESEMMPNAFLHIFDHISLADGNEEGGRQEKYLVRASYFEIYNEEIRDLLGKKCPKGGLELKESSDSGIFVKNLTSVVVKSVNDIENVLSDGRKNRSIGATLMNAGSSRSHSVFSIIVECCTADERGEHIRVGKLNLVDLAGSERQSKTGATGMRLKEATKINLSLSALGNVISALVDGKSSHIPYRDSKLTRILQDSLGGNTKTVMCAMVGPADYNFDETISTLRYASRAKHIKNKPTINEDPKDTMLREYQAEIEKLKAALSGFNGGTDTHNSREEGKFDHDHILVMERRAQEEKAELEQWSRAQLDERLKLQEKLNAENQVRKNMEEERLEMERKLKEMEAQLIIGGEIVDKTAKQEAALRKAEQDLFARKEKELALSRQMVKQEETNLELEEKYSSLADEVQGKTKKLQKVWSKFQQAKSEIKDLQAEFQVERDDLLNAIRNLTRELKLKELIIDHFVPIKYALVFREKEDGGCAVWNEDTEEWFIPRLELSGGSVAKLRDVPVSYKSSGRPETEFAKHMREISKSPRYHDDNIIELERVRPEPSTMSIHDNRAQRKARSILDCDVKSTLLGNMDKKETKKVKLKQQTRPSTSRKPKRKETIPERRIRTAGPNDQQHKGRRPSITIPEMSLAELLE